jgi:hypothetical protein
MPDDPHRGARSRQRERAAVVESILESVDPDLHEHAYPVNSHEFAAEYRGTEFDLANETESLADAFDRIAEEYDEFASAVEAREALTAELRRHEAFDEAFTDAVDAGTDVDPE